MSNPQVFVQVNWLAVALGTVFSMVLGFLWYGPLFGKLWLRTIGKKEEELKSSPGIYVLAFLGALVTGYVLAVLVAGLEASVWWWGAILGAVIGVGVGSASALVNGLFLGSSLELVGLVAAVRPVSAGAVRGGRGGVRDLEAVEPRAGSLPGPWSPYTSIRDVQNPDSAYRGTIRSPAGRRGAPGSHRSGQHDVSVRHHGYLSGASGA